MQYVQKSVASVASVVLALSVAGAALAQGAAPAAKASIGVVDRDKVITSFKKAQSAAEELKRVEENVRKLLE